MRASSIKTAAVAAACILVLAGAGLRADEAKPGQCAMAREEMMKKTLDLSSGQWDRWKDARAEERTQERLLGDKVRSDAARLAVLVDEKAPDTDLTQALDKLDADHKALVESRLGYLDKLRGILNPMQQAKAALWMVRHGQGRWNHHCDKMGSEEGMEGHRCPAMGEGQEDR